MFTGLGPYTGGGGLSQLLLADTWVFSVAQWAALRNPSFALLTLHMDRINNALRPDSKVSTSPYSNITSGPPVRGGTYGDA